jgi:hypothetical protein
MFSIAHNLVCIFYQSWMYLPSFDWIMNLSILETIIVNYSRNNHYESIMNYSRALFIKQRTTSSEIQVLMVQSIQVHVLITSQRTSSKFQNSSSCSDSTKFHCRYSGLLRESWLIQAWETQSIYSEVQISTLEKNCIICIYSEVQIWEPEKKDPFASAQTANMCTGEFLRHPCNLYWIGIWDLKYKSAVQLRFVHVSNINSRSVK